MGQQGPDEGAAAEESSITIESWGLTFDLGLVFVGEAGGVANIIHEAGVGKGEGDGSPHVTYVCLTKTILTLTVGEWKL